MPGRRVFQTEVDHVPPGRIEQVEGIERPEDDVPANRERRLEIADGILDVMPDKPEITHAVNAQPAYCPLRLTALS